MQAVIPALLVLVDGIRGVELYALLVTEAGSNAHRGSVLILLGVHRSRISMGPPCRACFDE